MKERPIIFNAAMVKAILDGGKTQTRRVMKPQPPHHEFSRRPSERLNVKTSGGQYVKCPYGQPGGRLWVRETFTGRHADMWWHDVPANRETLNWNLFYRATDKITPPRWTPSIFMPRWASRIVLEVINIRVERVQEITTNDIIAEGVLSDQSYLGSANRYRHPFIRLWDSINAKRGYGWDTNPWVWVIEFWPLAP